MWYGQELEAIEHSEMSRRGRTSRLNEKLDSLSHMDAITTSQLMGTILTF